MRMRATRSGAGYSLTSDLQFEIQLFIVRDTDGQRGHPDKLKIRNRLHRDAVSHDTKMKEIDLNDDDL